MPKVKTRHASDSSLVDFLEPAKELLPSEVPTLRAALQLALHLQVEKWRLEDIDKRNYPVSALMKDVANAVLGKWEWANALFQPSVTISSRSIERKLINEWEKSNLAARGKLSTDQTADLQEKLDKLLDPLYCKCQPIQECSEVGCLGSKQKPSCLVGAHLTCSCPRDNKIPKLELLFVKSQREKREKRQDCRLLVLISKKILGKEKLWQEKRLKL